MLTNVDNQSQTVGTGETDQQCIPCTQPTEIDDDAQDDAEDVLKNPCKNLGKSMYQC